MADFLTKCRTELLGVIVVGAVALLYLPSLRFQFVGLDDPHYVIENVRVRSGLTVENAVWAIRSCGYAENWHPLAWMSLQADANIARGFVGENAGDEVLSSVMHGHNVVLHAFNALLLFLLVAKASGSRLAALFFALAWALHPLRVEVVCWVSERKELLCVALMLAGLNLWIRKTGSYLLTLLLFALALSAKPLAVTLPCLLFAWDWIARKRPFLHSMLRALPFFALSAAASVLTVLAQSDALTVGNRFTAVQRLVMTLNAPIVYLRQTIWPVGLSVFYPRRPPLDLPETALGGILVVAIVWVCLRWLRRKDRWTGACAIAASWCYVGLIPMLGLVKVGDQSHSDRYTYWVGCGLAAFLAYCVARIPEWSAFRKWWQAGWTDRLAYASLVAIGILALMSAEHMTAWRDRISLYRDTTYKSWAEAAVCGYTRVLRKQGEGGIAEARRVLQEAIGHNNVAELRAEYAQLIACTQKHSMFWRPGDGVDEAFGEAICDAQVALEANPREYRAHEALGIIEFRCGNLKKAVSHISRAIELMVEAKEAQSDIDGLTKILDICKRDMAEDVSK